MANVTITPNMSLPSPNPSVDPGPDWASNLSACFFAIDRHNHTAGQGVPIPPAGLNINADLPMNVNNLVTIRSLRFSPLGGTISGGADLGCLFENGVDLYYTDGAGNIIRITQSGAVSGASGTITGLPSGTASASFSAGTFAFNSATSTPSAMAVGPLKIGAQIANPNTVTFQASASVASNFNVTLPIALPASTSLMNMDASGNMGTIAGSGTATGSGSVVLQTSPTINTPSLNAPTLNGTTTNGGTINGGAISGSTIDGSAIGGVTPAAGSFTNIIATGGGNSASQAFKTAVFNSTIAASAGATLTVSGASVILGVAGCYDLGASKNITISNYNATNSLNVVSNATSNVVQLSNGAGSTATYRIIVFYQ